MVWYMRQILTPGEVPVVPSWGSWGPRWACGGRNVDSLPLRARKGRSLWRPWEPIWGLGGSCLFPRYRWARLAPDVLIFGTWNPRMAWLARGPGTLGLMNPAPPFLGFPFSPFCQVSPQSPFCYSRQGPLASLPHWPRWYRGRFLR